MMASIISDRGTILGGLSSNFCRCRAQPAYHCKESAFQSVMRKLVQTGDQVGNLFYKWQININGPRIEFQQGQSAVKGVVGEGFQLRSQ